MNSFSPESENTFPESDDPTVRVEIHEAELLCDCIDMMHEAVSDQISSGELPGPLYREAEMTKSILTDLRERFAGAL